MEFTQAAVSFDGKPAVKVKTSVKVIKFGYSFIILIVISCYVGNMAVIQHRHVVDVPDDPISACAEDPGCHLCVHQIVKDYIIDKYPNVKYYESETSYKLLTDIANEKCSMSMTQGLHFQVLADDPLAPFSLDPCTLDYTPGSVYEIAISQPVKPLFRRP